MATLKVAFVWHMHQPWYLWPETREAALPYVRLHAYSGYYDMPWLLREFGETTVTFNLVPSLTEQIARYARGEVTDRLLELCRRPAAELDPDDQSELLTHLGRGQPEGVLEASPQFARLSHKRGHVRNSQEVERLRRAFTEAEFRDMQVWLNLVWCGYGLRRDSEVVRELRAKDRDFTEGDKLGLLSEMQAAMGRVLDLYRQAASSGRAELTTSPFYHPILPLLADMQDAARLIPRSELPDTLWQAPEEARRQLRLAGDHHEQQFGVRPPGLWSPEGAISDASLALVQEAGFAWTASDDAILSLSLDPRGGQRPSAEQLYQPYRAADSALALVFRDHALSDRIGFVYQTWEPQDAAEDMVGQLRRLASDLSGPAPGLVCIILDGENPWSSYPDAGEGFLRALYRGIETTPTLQTTLVSDYLREHPPQVVLPSVFPGSWIDHSYRTWIGGPEHRRAWSLLRGGFDAVERAAPSENAARAQEHLMAAEGSDWFWWYGEYHHADDGEVFDALFRAHVAEVYRALDQPEPSALGEPIAAAKMGGLAQTAAGAMRPTIDGRVTSYFEWQAAALLHTSAMASAMHRCDSVIRAIYIGFDREHVWLRVDTVGQATQALLGCRLRFTFTGEPDRELILEWPGNRTADPPARGGDLAGSAQVAADRIVEAALDLHTLALAPGDSLMLAVLLEVRGRLVERWPQTAYLEVSVPSDDALSGEWSA